VSFLFLASRTWASPPLKVGGTGAAYPILEKLVTEYQRLPRAQPLELIKPPMGSSAGIRAVMAGHLDLAVSGRMLKPEETQALTAKEFAHSPLAFVVNGSVGRDAISRNDLVHIYQGTLTHWNDGTPLRSVLRPASDADAVIVKSLSPEIERAYTTTQARPGMAFAAHDLENAEMLMKAKGMFGTLTLCQLHAQGLPLQVLALDAATPSAETLGAGTYPLSKPFTLVTRKSRVGRTHSFVQFLSSPKAKEILLASSCIPSGQ
jgi:phosphate transport system substrate-binding protein